MKIVIDESVSTVKFERFKTYAKKQGLRTSDCLLIKEKHPGMPDAHIMFHLLDKTTVFVTSDRPLHNKVLSKGLKSFYISETKITGKFLKGIQVKPDSQLLKTDHEIKDTYTQPKTNIRPLLMPTSQRSLKKLHTRQRRIRNYFTDLDHIEQAAVTVSWKEVGEDTLIGIRIRISSKVGIETLDASESYIQERIQPEFRDYYSVCWALVWIIRLMLHPVKITVFYDFPRMNSPQHKGFFASLTACFPDLKLEPAGKGFHIERVRKKLKQLIKEKSNEIVPGNMKEIMKKWSESEPPAQPVPDF